MARVPAQAAERLRPAVAHPSVGEQRLLQLLLHGDDVGELEREHVALAREERGTIVEPVGQRAPERFQVEERFLGHHASVA